MNDMRRSTAAFLNKYLVMEKDNVCVYHILCWYILIFETSWLIMLVKVGFQSKGLLTFSTLVAFECSMGLHVSSQIRSVCKTFSTVCTSKWLISCMGPVNAKLHKDIVLGVSITSNGLWEAMVWRMPFHMCDTCGWDCEWGHALTRLACSHTSCHILHISLLCWCSDSGGSVCV